jgi:hypothetical protein
VAQGPSGSGWFGFINVIKGLPVVPRIIMFVGLLALVSGFFSGTFALFHNPRISAGVALMVSSLAWRDWKFSRWHNPGPPHEGHWDFGHLLRALVFSSIAIWMFRVSYLSGKK